MSEKRYVMIHDLINPDTGMSYKEENLKKQHNVPIGTKVLIEMYVTEHRRDCDGTPLYCLGFHKGGSSDLYGWTERGITEHTLTGEGEEG